MKLFSRLSRSAPLLGAVLALVSAAFSGAVAAASETDAMGGGDRAAPLTRDDVNAWLDGVMPYALETGGFVGAVVSVVKDGQLLTSRGYGHADLESRKTMDPATTLVRPGSISKLFTWTAVMQQVERGALDLDTDINTYLDFDIAGRNGAAITLRHLMTHTAGFEDTTKGMMVARASELPSLEEYLKQTLPARVFPPGKVPAYSNYGTALAGYIVQRVSGQSFDEYMEAHILSPLGMEHSSFRQPLPGRFETLMSEGYKSRTDGRPQAYELIPPAPAGALAATADDMARFMIAHLRGDGGLLQPATLNRMHTTVDRHLPRVNPMALGFYRKDRYGVPIIGHGGDTVYFHSDLSLFPEQGVGLFVSLNSAGATATASLLLRERLLSQFTRRYFTGGDAGAPAVAPQAAEGHGGQIAGVYESSRAALTNFMAMARYLGQLRVSVDASGNLSMPFFGEPAQWREVAPYVWRREGGPQRLAAVVADGEVQGLAFEPASPFMVFTPAPWYRSSALLTPLFLVALLVLLATSARGLARQVASWRPGSRAGSPRRTPAHRAARLGVLLVLAYLLGWGLLLGTLLSDILNMNSGFDGLIRLLQWSQFAVYGALALGLWHTVDTWRRRDGWFTRLWSILLVLAMAVVIWMAWVGGLLSFELSY